MILTLDEARNLCPGKLDDELKALLDAIEGIIRAYTNNPFQVRLARFSAPSVGDTLEGISPYIQADDTIQISESGVNDGLYVVVSTDDYSTTVDRDLFDVDHNLVTKIFYPAPVKAVARNLLKWETENRDKVGVKSETISRHSVTYYDQDASNQVMGYPVSLLGGLKPYMRARF